MNIQSIKDRVSAKFKTCYRIVTDSYAGYEVQERVWWFPTWIQANKHNRINTFCSIEEAKEWIEQGCKQDPPKSDNDNVVWNSCK